MVRGTLEVLLVGAKGLENTDFLSKFALSNTLFFAQFYTIVPCIGFLYDRLNSRLCN